MTKPLEFQAKWDYVEAHGLHTVTPRPGYVVTLEDSAGQHWSGDSLQGAIEAHATARPEVEANTTAPDSRLEYLEAVADGMPDDHDWSQYGNTTAATAAPPTHYCSYCRYYGDDTLGTLEDITAHGQTHPVTGEALPLEDDA